MLCKWDIQYIEQCMTASNIQSPICAHAQASWYCSTTFSIFPTASWSYAQPCPKTSQPCPLDTPGQRIVYMLCFICHLFGYFFLSANLLCALKWSQVQQHDWSTRRHLMAGLLGHSGAHLLYHRAAFLRFHLHLQRARTWTKLQPLKGVDGFG